MSPSFLIMSSAAASRALRDNWATMIFSICSTLALSRCRLRSICNCSGLSTTRTLSTKPYAALSSNNGADSTSQPLLEFLTSTSIASRIKGCSKLSVQSLAAESLKISSRKAARFKELSALSICSPKCLVNSSSAKEPGVNSERLISSASITSTP